MKKGVGASSARAVSRKEVGVARGGSSREGNEMGDSAKRATIASPRGVPMRCYGLQFLEVWCELALFVYYATPRRRSSLTAADIQILYAGERRLSSPQIN